MSTPDNDGRRMRRGLSALLADVGVSAGDVTPNSHVPDRTFAIERVHPNPDQPRRTFDEEGLSDLAASIAQRGIIQPLIVRPLSGRPGEVQIVAGERRWRAAQRAGLHEVPVIIRELDDTEVLEVAIVENIQRADLNAVEEALSFQQLMQRFGHTQEQLSEVLGKSRSHIANLMRLLKLPEPVQDMLRQGALSAGHARALVVCDDPTGLARQVISRGLSVRQTERLAKQAGSPAAKRSKRDRAKDADTEALENDLSASLAAPVSIKHDPTSGTGTIMIRYSSLDELDGLCARLSRGHS